MLYIVGDCYAPGTPGENRFDGLCRGIVQQGYSLTRVFLRPNLDHSKAADKTTGIEYKYLWEGKSFKKGKWRHIQQIVWLFSFLRTVTEQDKIIVTNSDYLFVYSWFPLLHVFHEKSEYPELQLPSLPWIIRKMFRYYLSTCRHLDGIFTISYSLKDYFVSQGVAPDKIKVINMTVDPSRFIRLKKEKVVNKYIAYCGSVSNFKDGVDILIKAFSIVAKQIDVVRLYIIGDFPFKRDQEDDYALVKSLGLTDRVVFTGQLPREEMPQLLKNAEVLVLTRPDNIQAKYGFPTKLGEYLLTENPVVLTRVGEIPMFLKDEESAFIASPGNIEEIASKIIDALTSPKALNIGKRGADVALRHFNSFTESKKIIEFIYGR